MSTPSELTGNHTEDWRPVPGYEGFYEASDFGRIRSVRHWTRVGWRGGIILAQFTDADGYYRVNLSREGAVRSKPVHALVLAAFRGEPPEGWQGCHGGEGRTDNRLANLYWGTAQVNSDDKYRDGTMACGERQGSSRLRTKDILAIRQRYASGEGQEAIARDFGVSQAHVSRIILRQSWKHVP